MNEFDVTIRNLTYALFAELGRAPTNDEVATASGSAISVIDASWHRLHADHALVLNQATGQILMANPFSAVPTPYRVEAAGRSWYANCAWDAFGICAALDVDGRIHTACPDCQTAIEVSVHDRRPDDPNIVCHLLVPAARWWDDIVFT